MNPEGSVETRRDEQEVIHSTRARTRTLEHPQTHAYTHAHTPCTTYLHALVRGEGGLVVVLVGRVELLELLHQLSHLHTRKRRWVRCGGVVVVH
jgi:hypothetical protein